MELDRVDAMAETVVRAQARLVAMRVEAEAIEFVARQRAVGRQPRHMRIVALAQDRFAQRGIGSPQVARREFRRLVVDGVRLEGGHGVIHGQLPRFSRN